MTLRRKTLAICAILMSVMVLCMLGFLYAFLSFYVEKVDQDMAKKNLLETVDVVKEDLGNVDRVVLDWAAWDDMYRYVQDPRPDFEQSNLSLHLFEEQNLQFLALINSQQRIFFWREYYPDERELVNYPHPRNAAEINRLIAKLQQEGSSEARGLLFLAQGPALVSVHRVMDTNKTKETEAWFVGGEFLSESKIGEDIWEKEGELRWWHSDQAGFPWLTKSALNHAGIDVTHMGEQNYSIIYLQDVFGEQTLALLLKQPRVYYQQTLTNFTYLALIFFLLVLLCVASIYFMLKKLVLDRIQKVTDYMEANKNLSEDFPPLVMAGRDEISFLAKRLEQFLTYLSSTYKRNRFMGLHDGLTGVWNRLAYEADRINYYPGYLHSCGIVMIDVDGLKMINDVLGHEAGDKAIKRVAQVLMSRIGKEGKVYRIGGDEFLCVLPMATSGHMDAWAQNLQKELDSIEGMSFIPCRASVGYSWKRPEQEFELLVQWADHAMYKCKPQRQLQFQEKVMAALQESLLGMEKEGIKRIRCYATCLAEQVQGGEGLLAEVDLLAEFCHVGKIGQEQVQGEDQKKYQRRQNERGFCIAQLLPILQPIAKCILHYYESWDGTGVPGGLQGDEIPLAGRIVRIAEAYDNLLSESGAMDAVPAATLLRQKAERELDPELVDLFLTHCRNI